MKTFRDYLNQIDSTAGPKEGDALDLVLNEELVVETDIVDRDGNNVFIGMDRMSYQMLEEAGMLEQTAPATWKQIYDLNKATIGADPNKIKPGQVLQLPGGGSYTVKKGDNLTKIAQGGAAAPAAATAAEPAAAPAATAPKATDAASLKAAQDAAAGTATAPATATAAAPAAADGTTQDIERLKNLAGADAGDQQTSNYTGQVQKSPEPAPAASADTLGQRQPGGQGSYAASATGAEGTAQGQAAQPAAPAAPAATGTANPWTGTDPAKAAAWDKLSPEDQKWIGKADPTDKFILARAPSKGGFLGSIGLGKKSAGPTGNVNNQTSGYAQAGQAAQPDSGPGQTYAVSTPDVGQPEPLKEAATQDENMLFEEFNRMLELAGLESKKKDIAEQGGLAKAVGAVKSAFKGTPNPPAAATPAPSSSTIINPATNQPFSTAATQTAKAGVADMPSGLPAEYTNVWNRLTDAQKQAVELEGIKNPGDPGEAMTKVLNNILEKNVELATVAQQAEIQQARELAKGPVKKYIQTNPLKTITAIGGTGAGLYFANKHYEKTQADIRSLAQEISQKLKQNYTAEEVRDWIVNNKIADLETADQATRQAMEILKKVQPLKPYAPPAPAPNPAPKPMELTPQQKREMGAQDAPPSTVKENLRYFTRNPNDGQIVEVFLNSALNRGSANNVDQRHTGGLQRNGQDTWRLDAWSEKPISKLVKGI
jgi:LysM repeat protein